MTKIAKVWDAADGSGTPGRVFTASIAQEVIPAMGKRLDFLKMGVKGAVSTAAVVIETFAGLISPFTLRKGAANRIVLALDELCALSVYYYRSHFVAIGENTDATGNDFIGNIRIPVNDDFDPANQFLISADRVAQTNIATETVSLTSYADYESEARKPVHAVRIQHTTSGTAGIEQMQSKIPAVGILKALILKVPNGFADGNVDTSIQRLKIYDDMQVVAEFNDLGDAENYSILDYVTPGPQADLFRQFRVFNLGDNGLDATKGTLSYAFDVQDVSDAVVIIPVLDITVAGA